MVPADLQMVWYFYVSKLF